MQTETQGNLFRGTAQWYDVDDRNVSRDDIPFFLKYASDAGKVLEFACGTGRVAIRLAEAGNEMWGVDLSTEMLGEFNKKFETMDPQVANRIHITYGDMCSVDLGLQLPLIIIPFRSFQALLTEQQQRDCLANARRHMTDDGRFIINVFRPLKDKLDQSWVREETLDWEKDDPRTGCHVRRTHIQRRIDTETQIIYPELIYYITHPDGKQERIVEPIPLRYHYENQMRQLLISSGLDIESEMGYYDGRPISEGPELIFICRKG